MISIIVTALHSAADNASDQRMAKPLVYAASEVLSDLTGDPDSPPESGYFEIFSEDLEDYITLPTRGELLPFFYEALVRFMEEAR